MEAEQRRKRRRYSRELKAQILAECELPGMSVAKVALAHGITRAEAAVVRQELELRRGTMAIKLLWPTSAAAQLAAFTRELLR